MKNTIYEYLMYFCEDNLFAYSQEELKEIKKFLLSRNCQYVSEGAFSCVFKNTEFVYIVSSLEDWSKQYTEDSAKEFGNAFLPKIERVYTFDSFTVWKEEILDIKSVFTVNVEQAKFVADLNDLRFISAMDFIFTETYEKLSEDLQDFFRALANKYQYSVELDFTLQNIGWRNDTPVFFDVILPTRD